MWEAIKSRFGENDESKKMQKYILKQQFEGFSVSNSEGLHKGYDMFQSLLSQLEIHGAGVSTENANQKFLRVFESNVKGSTASSSCSHNVAFVSSDNTNSTNEVDAFYLEEMDLKWKVAMLSTRLKKFYKKTRKKLHFDTKELVGFDKTKVKCFNFHNTRHFAKECRSKGNQESVDWTGHTEDDTENYALMAFNSNNSSSNTEVEAQLVCHQKNQLAYEEKNRFMKIDLDDKTNVLIYHMKLLAEAEKEKEELKTKLENFQSSSKGLSKLLNSQMSAKDISRLGYGTQIHEGVLSYKNEVLESVFDSRSSDVEDSHVNARFAKVEGMHVVPPPTTRIYVPRKYDFRIDESKFTYGLKYSKTSESDAKTSDLASCESNSSVETLESVPKLVESKPKAVSEPKVWSDAPIIEKYESDSDDGYVFKASVEQEKPSCAFINTAKHVKTPKQTVKDQDTCSQNHKVPKRDWTILMSKRLGLRYGYTRKTCFDNPHQTLKGKGIVDSGCSRHMTENKAYLVEYQDFNGGHVAFGGSKGQITGKGKIRTRKLDFEDVYFVKELQHFDLFSVSQMNSEMKAEHVQEYCVLPLWSSYTSTVKSSEANNKDKKLIGDTGSKTNKEPVDQEDQAFLEELARLKRQEKKADGAPKTLRKMFAQEDFLIQQELLELAVLTILEDIYKVPNNGIFTSASYDDEGTVADFTNLESTVNVSTIPQYKIHSIHPTTQFLRDPTSAVQTRRKSEQKNKKDERGVVVRNKARLVAQEHRQEERIDYDEVFALVARIKAIRIFLAFDSYMGFIVYQMDVKSAFLYRKIDEEVYVSQPPCFIDPKFLNKVYKVVKDLYGLHQAPRAWYTTLSTFLVQSGYIRGLIDKTLFIKKDKKDIMVVQVYVDDVIFSSTKKSWCDEFEALMKSRFQLSSMEILKKFDFMSVKTASTPIKTKKPLVKDAEAADVDVTPKTSHLHAVKRIFRYLKGQPKLGLWYPRESVFDLKAYSNSDCAGANLDKKSTTKGCQFLGRRLIS
uniref:Uncharacterized protein n=1 Tax=Tanacetum cinerariifolium TaxID=118510 RepID=A0A6L2KUI6_TANCI|nr:hypothetical protein [Tanacetum cinerariifolium]